jgi:triosephosphate isomerase
VSNVRLGAQNMHEAASGAYTGEISAGMLRELYVRYVIIGHSERRQYFHEDNATVNRKTKAALAAELRPIVCVGETLARTRIGAVEKGPRDPIGRGAGRFWRQGPRRHHPRLRAGLGHRHRQDRVARAGGGGPPVDPKVLGHPVQPRRRREKIRIQYGGSVKPENAKELLSKPDIDGALVGGASLDARGFTAIIKNACLRIG